MSAYKENSPSEVEAAPVEKPARLHESIERLEEVAMALEKLRCRSLETPVPPFHQEQLSSENGPASLATLLMEGPGRIDQLRDHCMSLIKDIESILF